MKACLCTGCLLLLASSLVAQQIPHPWKSARFSKHESGVTFSNNGTVEIRAKSLDMWEKRDDFYFVYQPITGNGQITARIAEISEGDQWAKGGIMFRNSLTSDSRHFSLLVTPGHGHATQLRLHDGNVSDGISALYGSSYNWLRMVRVGNDVVSSLSADGKNWMAIYWNEIALNENLYVGLAVSSHDSTQTFKIRYDNISIIDKSTDTELPSAPGSIEAKFISPTVVSLQWSASSDDSGIFCYNVLAGGMRLNKTPLLKPSFVIDDWSPSRDKGIVIQAVDIVGNTSKSLPLRINASAATTDPVIPKTNPLVTTSKRHWTDSLRWHYVVNVNTVPGLLDQDNKVDSMVLHNTIKDLSSKGGGVLYFPGGKYYFSSSVYLKSGVIIRGAEPVGATDAKEINYAPATKFIFPRYVPTYTGTGTPNHTAFKAFFADVAGVSNIGLVNIDINRACIRLDGSNIYRRSVNSMSLEVPWFKNVHRNVLIYGVRQNNAALPSPLIPSKVQIDEGHAWQRWPWVYGFNISVSVSRNCAIINCRLNDDNNPENFAQPNYITDDLKMTSGHYSDFPFKSHYPININFVRIFQQSDGKLTFDHPQSYRTLFRNPVVYPELFVKGIEVKNNVVILSRMDLFNLNLINWMVPNTTELGTNVIGTCCEQDHQIRDNGHELIVNDWLNFAKDEKILKKRRHSYGTHTLPYRLLDPANASSTTSYPLIVFLHGGGESGTDNEMHLKNFSSFFFRENIRKNFPSYVLMPQHDKDRQFASNNFRDHPPWPLAATMDLIDSLVQHLNIDRTRVYLIGLSSGATAVWEAAARYPKVFAAGISFGGISSQWADAEFAKRCKTTPIWHFHGINDVSIPAKIVQAAFLKLGKNGVTDWRLKIYDGVAHGSWILAMEEPDLFTWFFSHHSGRFRVEK